MKNIHFKEKNISKKKHAAMINFLIRNNRKNDQNTQFFNWQRSEVLRESSLIETTFSS